MSLNNRKKYYSLQDTFYSYKYFCNVYKQRNIHFIFCLISCSFRTLASIIQFNSTSTEADIISKKVFTMKQLKMYPDCINQRFLTHNRIIFHIKQISTIWLSTRQYFIFQQILAKHNAMPPSRNANISPPLSVHAKEPTSSLLAVRGQLMALHSHPSKHYNHRYCKWGFMKHRGMSSLCLRWQ